MFFYLKRFSDFQYPGKEGNNTFSYYRFAAAKQPVLKKQTVEECY